MIKKLAVFILLGTLTLGLSGCASLGKKDAVSKSMPLEPSIMTRFNDIPVPTGFKLLTKESYSFESGGVRVGVMKYKGRAGVDQLVNFYKEQMPMYNWRLLNVIEYNQRLLNFDRENETCLVSIAAGMVSSTITVSLGPKSQVPKKSEKPIK